MDENKSISISISISRAAANWRNCKYVYNNIPVFAVFA